MIDANENPATTLQRLRAEAATEDDPAKLKTIASHMLRVLKKEQPPPSQTWAKRVKNLRKNLELSQTEFAAKLNCSAMTVSRWERGLQEPPTRCLLELGKLAGPSRGWAFWNMAGITIEDVRAMLNGRVAGKP